MKVARRTEGHCECDVGPNRNVDVTEEPRKAVSATVVSHSLRPHCQLWQLTSYEL